MRSINLILSELFQRYSIALSKITGGELIGRTQVKQVQDIEGVSIPYDKGRIAIRNNIDKLNFLLDHKKEVAEAIGTTSKDIYSNRRNIGKVTEYLAKMDARYDVGTFQDNMQLYISKYDKNVGILDSQKDWIDYIMTQTWIDKLAEKSVGAVQSTDDIDTNLVDFRINYLADMIHGMVKDHEIDYHRSLDEFDETLFLNSGKNNWYIDALNRLNSIGKLDHGFYEVFKPIGGTSEKYIKVKLSTTGEIDISGVVGLEDCKHVEWEYGSKAYLRSLNTGNQRYDFKISRPFNDENSTLWWKPDNPEDLQVPGEYDISYPDKIPEPVSIKKYYKEYETERFLRWFGTSKIPRIDANTITKMVVCSAPSLSSDVQGDKFFDNAINITGTDAPNLNLSRVNIEENTSQSLLTLAPRATIKLEDGDDGQYLSFVVSGHQQISTLAFNIRGKIVNDIEELNHYANTWELFNESRIGLEKTRMFMEISNIICPTIKRTWAILFEDEEWIPRAWNDVLGKLESLRTPGPIELIRMRQIDLELIDLAIIQDVEKRIGFLVGIDGNENHIRTYVATITESSSIADRVIELAGNETFWNAELYNYIQNYGTDNASLADWYSKIPLAGETKETIINKRLKEITEVKEPEKYTFSYDNMTVDELRERIVTFNNLIVRLPPDPDNPEMMKDTYRYNVISRHIFLDWKTFVDRTVAKMVQNGTSTDTSIPQNKKLYVKMEGGKWKKVSGIGTDGESHEYTELYVDSAKTIPLVDYSYIVVSPDEKGVNRANHDRWDYWSAEDFE